MTNGRRIVLVTCVVVTVLALHANAQTARIDGGVRSQAGFDFYWETRLVPPIPALGEDLRMLTLTTGADTVHRVMIDRAKKLYFGYDAHVTVVRRTSEERFVVDFGPLTLTRELRESLGADAGSWKLLPAPRFPEPRTIRAGEVLELALLTSNGGRQQMVEYVTVLETQEPQRLGFTLSNQRPTREFAFAVGNPRDFTTADVELRLEQPRLTAGALASIQSQGEAAGPIVWVYVPNRGRFLLSLTPRANFRRSGDVRGTALRFTVDGQTYDILSASRIAPATAAFNLYVLHQPARKPSYPSANLETIHIGSADRPEYLLGR
jgi:hypothetical protein